MTMVARLVWLGCVAAAGCAGYTNRPPPGPLPVPEPQRPAPLLRERVPRADSGEVVLDDRDGLSPEEAALMAVDNNPRLRAIRAERGIGEAEVLAAGVLPNPRLDGALEFPVSGDARVLGYGAGVSWNVTPLLSRGARVSAAEENLASVDLEVAWQEWQVAQAARLHAIRATYLARRARLAAEIEQTWSERLSALRQARAASAVTDIEVGSAERSFAEARVTRLELEQRLEAERVELSSALGVDATTEITLDTTFTPMESAPSDARLLDELPRRRLDLIALQHAQRSHDEGLRAAAIAQFPPVEVGFQAARGVDRVGSAGIALSFEIPFFDRNQGNVARERALRVKVEAEYDARLLEARADVVRTLKELRLLREQLVAAKDALDAAGRLAEQVRTAVTGGALSPLLVADILERVYTARLRMLEIEQVLAELQVALAVASGVDVR